MKRFLHFLVAAGVALVGLAACNKTLPVPSVDEGQPEAIEIALKGCLEAEVSTRVTEVTQANFTSGLYISAVTGSSTEAGVANFNSVTFTKEGDVWKGGKYWPDTDPGYKFYGSNSAITFAASGSTVKPGATISDVICGYQSSTTKGQTVNLTMDHIFSRLVGLTVNAPSDGCAVSGLTVTFTPKVPNANTTYNMKTAAWATTANGTAQTLLSNQSIAAGSSASAASSTDVWCIPQSDYKLVFTYTLTKGDFVKTYTAVNTQNLAFLAGKKHTVTATLPGAGTDISEIEVGITITPWDPNPLTAEF